KSVRLHKARSLIVDEGVGAAVAATSVGYESASQFSREFKRFFGASPSEEAKRVRALLAAPPAGTHPIERARPFPAGDLSAVIRSRESWTYALHTVWIDRFVRFGVVPRNDDVRRRRRRHLGAYRPAAAG